jgi:hypothetical protein
MSRYHDLAGSGGGPRTVAALGKILVLKHRNVNLIKGLGRIPLRGRPSQTFLAE